MILGQYGVLHYIFTLDADGFEVAPADVPDDRVARLLLIKLLQAVSSDIKPKLIGCRHASEVWQRLKPSLTALDAHTVTTELNHVSLLNHDTLEKYLLHLNILLNKLRCMPDNGNTTEKDVVHRALYGLEDTYRSKNKRFALVLY